MYGCRNCEASQQYYNTIFQLYASWGVDFVKCDDICVTEFRKWDNPYSADYEIEMIRNAINNCGREMVLSLSPGPAQVENAAHLKQNADMWRMTGDFGICGLSFTICLINALRGRIMLAAALGRIAICCRSAGSPKCALSRPSKQIYSVHQARATHHDEPLGHFPQPAYVRRQYARK